MVSTILNNKFFQIGIGAIMLAVIGFLMTFGLEKTMDIFFLDETAYLVRGTNMFEKIPKRWGPLYCTWYKILSLFEGNLIKLFYLNFKLISVLPAILFFIVLRRYSKSLILPFFIAACFLISAINLPIYPKVSFFCIMIIFTALWISSYLKQGFYKWLSFLSAALILSFVRPEFYMTFLLIFLVGVGLLVFKKATIKKKNFAPLVGFVLVAIVLHAGLGNPLTVKLDGHNRSLIAFGEHFAYNSAQWNDSELYSWLAWEEEVHESFGDVHSVSDVMKSNPSLFFKHVGTNISNFFSSFFEVVVSLMLPFKIGKIGSFILGLFITLGLLLTVLRQWKQAPPEIAYLILLAIPTLISCVLVYPRNHYLVLLVPIIGILIVSVFKFLEEDKKIALPGLIVIGLLFIVFGPRANDFKFFEFRKDEGVLNNLTAIQMFNQSKFDTPIRTLSNEGDFSAFLQKEVVWISAIDKRRASFNQYLSDSNPDVIYITETMLKNPYYFEDDTWQEFLINYSANGYQKVTLGEGINEYFLVKNNLTSKFQ